MDAGIVRFALRHSIGLGELSLSQQPLRNPDETSDPVLTPRPPYDLTDPRRHCVALLRGVDLKGET